VSAAADPTLRPAAVLARVDDELRALWSAPPVPGATPRARACTMNLVVVAATPATATAWVPIVDEVILSIPARAIVVGLDPDAPNGLEASTSAVCGTSEGDGPAVCSERVTLTARGTVCERIASCIDTLCATDVPTTLVWLGRVHVEDPVFEPLARDAQRIVLDAAQGSVGSLASVVQWARSRPEWGRPGVADLTWTRLAPWQEMCARMFDEPRLRDLSANVTGVTLVQASPAGAPMGAEGALLLGWLATRLGWRAGALAGKLRLQRRDGAHVHAALCGDPSGKAAPNALVAVRLEASAGGVRLRGAIEREKGGDAATWRLETTGPDGEPRRLEQHVRMQLSAPPVLLERTLHRPMRDAALAESATWADELGGEELACGGGDGNVGSPNP
jgi:glucose-6-phosphate dehydrogenase assembly protein OpcA